MFFPISEILFSKGVLSNFRLSSSLSLSIILRPFYSALLQMVEGSWRQLLEARAFVVHCSSDITMGLSAFRGRASNSIVGAKLDEDNDTGEDVSNQGREKGSIHAEEAMDTEAAKEFQVTLSARSCPGILINNVLVSFDVNQNMESAINL